jgi:hypothetical protein
MTMTLLRSARSQAPACAVVRPITGLISTPVAIIRIDSEVRPG